MIRMQVTYCARWSDQVGAPTDMLTEQAARKRNDTGESYAVVVGDSVAPDAVIEIAWLNDYLGVYFLDSKLRRALRYSFRRYDERLFLKEIVSWEYPEDGYLRSDATKVDTLVYEPDGLVRHKIIDRRTRETTVSEYADVELDINWEPIPTFGDWNSVARRDREAVSR